MLLTYKLKRFLLVGSLTILMAFIGAVIARMILKYLGIEYQNHAKAAINTLSPTLIFIIVSFIAPISEELGLRLHLKFSPLKFAISFGILFYFLIGTLMGKSYYIPEETFYYRIAAALVVIGLIYVVVRRNSIEAMLSHIWQKYSKSLYILFALLFGFFHLQNFPLAEIPVYGYPLLVVPQLIYGFSFGYLRLRLGIIWSIGLHCVINML
jgi:uncharacterized protein